MNWRLLLLLLLSRLVVAPRVAREGGHGRAVQMPSWLRARRPGVRPPLPGEVSDPSQTRMCAWGVFVGGISLGAVTPAVGAYQSPRRSRRRVNACVGDQKVKNGSHT